MTLLSRSKVKPVVLNFTDDPDVAKGIVVPDGGKLLVVKTRVDPMWAWPVMLQEACPDYQSRDVRSVSDLFPPEQGEPKNFYVFGLNFGHSIRDTMPAVEWGKENKLDEATPRQIFSVARDVPDLNRKVDMSWMGLISPKFCAFEGRRRVCSASFGGARREANLDWFDDEWHGSAWFGFSRECPSA
jgi:hypothetical protein